jgi:hypothetical protein
MRNPDFSKKIIFSGLAMLILLMASTSNLDYVFNKVGIDRMANNYLHDATKRAVTTFAVAKSINAGISVLKNSSANAGVGVAGISAGIGHALDPIDNQIEQFASIMLLSTVSLMIQNILINIGNVIGLKIFLSISMIILLIGIWLKNTIKYDLVSLSYKLICVSLLIKFTIPFIVVSSGLSYDYFLDKKYNEAIGHLEKSKDTVASINFNETNSDKKTGIVDYLKESLSSATNILDIKSQIQNLVTIGSKWSDYIITLIAVFIMQTILIPLVVLYGLIKLFKALVDPAMANKMLIKFKETTINIENSQDMHEANKIHSGKELPSSI